MTYTFKIPFRLPSLNEYSDAERAHRQKAAKMKSEVEKSVILFARSTLKGVHITKPVTMHYKWIEPNRRRDKDNIAFARKFIQDALVKAKILQGDGWKHIISFSDEFAVDKSPGVVVTLMEVDAND